MLTQSCAQWPALMCLPAALMGLLGSPWLQVQQRVLALCQSNPVISVRDFDEKVCGGAMGRPLTGCLLSLLPGAAQCTALSL